jgi:hypothetical protein
MGITSSNHNSSVKRRPVKIHPSAEKKFGPPNIYSKGVIKHERESSYERTTSTAYLNNFEELAVELAEMPSGSRAIGQLCTLRLVNRDAFLAIPEVQDAVHTLKEIISGMTLVQDYHDGFPVMEFDAATKSILSSFLNPSNADKLRSAVASQMRWNENSDDSFFRLFDVHRCPEFTFISHRWADADHPFGRHNELLLVLSLCPEQWFWLDYCCVPQTDDQFDNHYAAKVKWNISTIITLAQNMITYYPVDGLSTHALEGLASSEVSNFFFPFL